MGEPKHAPMKKPDDVSYRCKACGDIPEPETHHKMASCKCGKVSVDRGWYGSRVLWDGGKYEDCVEVIPATTDGEQQ